MSREWLFNPEDSEDSEDDYGVLTNLYSDLEVRHGSDPVLVLARCFNVVTAVCAILCASVNVVSATEAFRRGDNVFIGILSCYGALIALLLALAETEWGCIFHFLKVLKYWVGRGMLQVFLAIMTKALGDLQSRGHWMVVLQELSSYMLLVCGLLYLLLGMLFIGHLKRARLRRLSQQSPYN